MLKSGNKLLTGTFAASAKSSASLTGLRMLKPTDEVQYRLQSPSIFGAKRI